MKFAGNHFYRCFTSLLLSYVLLWQVPLAGTASASRERRGPSNLSESIFQQHSARYRSGELLVRFRVGLSDHDKAVVIASQGARRKQQLRGESRVEKLELASGQDPEMAARHLRLNPGIEFAEPNFLINHEQLQPESKTPSFTGQPKRLELPGFSPSAPTNPGTALPRRAQGNQPNDARFAEQWSLSNTGQNGGQFGSDINATNAWQRTTGSVFTVIAVIDSGIDFTHPDLANNKWTNPFPFDADLNGWDYITDSATIRDEQGHGTAIAGIIAAEGNNTEGVSGVMWRASLMSLRVLDNTGTGDVADAVEAIDYAVAHDAQVINISWGTGGESMALKDAIERAIRRGVVVVCSAGNNGRDLEQVPYYPASFNIRNLIAVASSDAFDQLPAWSNWGRRQVTVAAPGVNILTTRMGGGYWTVTGTSASAPLVSGVAGLIKTLRPRFSATHVMKAIADSGRRVASLSGKLSSGAVVNAFGALDEVRGIPNPVLPHPTPGYGSGGNGPGGSFSTDPPPPKTGAPEPNLPNLDELRNATPQQPTPQQRIQSNLSCGDCDPQSGGGGSGNYPSGDPNFSSARERPHNETGEEGVDLGSRNFNWSLPIVSLPGRAGLDLNLGLAYNSLVWTKDGSFIKFNADFGTPAPGFRLGLPTLQQRFFNSQTGSYAYLMNTPSGGRIEMRQVSTNVYEAADGSYTQLTEGPAQPVDLNFPAANNYYYLVARHSGKIAGVAAASQSNGAHVVQWDWSDVPQNEFQLVPTDSGYYKLVARHSGKVWAVEGQWTTNGAKVMQWDWVSQLNEQWKPIPTDSGYYKLEARHSGKVAAVEGQWTTNGAKVLQWAWDGQSNMQWRFIPADTVTVRTSDGTQYTFTQVAVNNEYRCTEIKDRNGNFITATYNNTTGKLLTITDTLGRVVTFVYDTNNNLEYIRQTWAGVTHNWARFEYGEVLVQPQFGGGLLVNGPSNNLVTVLTRVTLHDQSYFIFEYNAAFGQVKKINHHAADGHLLGYTLYNVSSSAGQTDCPRFTERRDWAQNWNSDNDGVPTAVEEVVTTYAVAADNSWSKVTLPDGVIHKEFFATTSWQTGLPTSTKTYANAADETADAWKKRSTISWTQDNEALSFPKNPRVFDTTTFDAEGNQKRIAITYTSFSLPSEVKEYASDGTTILRRTTTSYELSSAYTDRRVIGLASAINVIDHATSTTLSKRTFEYDWSGEYLVATPQAATQHDVTNYGTGFVAGRGNLAAVKRWDITDINNAVKAIAQTRMAYNTTGCTVFTRDALDHQTTISYADSFSDSVNRNTFAYPTTVTNADNFSSTVQYNFDFGAVTRMQDPKGAAQTMDYDASGRISKVTNLVNNAFTEWVYLPTMTEVNQKITVVPGSIADQTQRAFSTTLLDGAGRVRYSASDLPPTAGRYSTQRFVYDNMGRLVQRSNPTETDGSWIPTGDDSAWFFTLQTYDWKGRSRVTTFTDGNTRENTYGGCGCAGGEVTTVRDERGRRRKLTTDVLGRLKQVEELNWNQTAYSTTTYTYNVRDQITNINHAGQTRSFAYDPYSRLQSRTTPEQGTTSYTYFADNTVQTVTDARGATKTFAYNNRHLVTGITYGVPGGVAATPNVTFGYDQAGNRTSMTDGLGSVSYNYNTLSQLTSETRTFTGVGSFSLSYDYSNNLIGQLTSVTNPWNAQVGYNYDKIGRPTSVSGSGFAGVSSYINSFSYRAFGVKQMAYANGRTLSLQYDNRLRLTRWDVPGVMGWEYAYHYFGENNGRVTYAKNLIDPTMDRSYDYDHVGRLTVAYSGEDARAAVGIPGSQWGIQDGPYAHPNFYDVWGNITGRQGWGGANPWFSATYTNNKRDGFSYDAAGNVTYDGGQNFTYDATGQQATATFTGFSLQQFYDGDTLRVKKIENGTTTYYLRSSVLGGQVVAEINSSGTWTRGYVYLGRQMIAIQHAGAVSWVFQDPIVKSQRVTNASGVVTALIELDPFGGEIGMWAGGSRTTFNMTQQPHRYTTYERDGNASDEAMFRRYNRWHARFDQPDPYDGSYAATDPQSFNRYAYVQNDPVNFVYPTGLVSTGEDGGTDPTKTWMGQSGGIFGSGGGGFHTFTTTGYIYLGIHLETGLPAFLAVPVQVTIFLLGGLFGGNVGGGGGGGGGGNSQKPKTPTFEDKVRECADKLFGVQMTNFVPTQPGVAGSFTGVGPDVVRNRGNNRSFTVYNDASSMTQAQLGTNFNTAGGGGPLTGYTPSNHPDNRPRGLSPFTNYTGSDLTNGRAVRATQVHELGNSLAYITGIFPAMNGTISPPQFGSDNDPGVAMERCVFGGDVNTKGQVLPPGTGP